MRKKSDVKVDILQFLANHEHGRCEAREIAAGVGVKKRTANGCLQELDWANQVTRTRESHQILWAVKSVAITPQTVLRNLWTRALVLTPSPDEETE